MRRIQLLSSAEKLMAAAKLKQNFACFHWMITGTRVYFFLIRIYNYICSRLLIISFMRMQPNLSLNIMSSS